MRNSNLKNASLSILNKLESLPPGLKKEANDFIEYFIEKTKKNKQINEGKTILGCIKGKIIMKDDFDAPIDLFNELSF